MEYGVRTWECISQTLWTKAVPQETALANGHYSP